MKERERNGKRKRQKVKEKSIIQRISESKTRK